MKTTHGSLGLHIVALAVVGGFLLLVWKLTTDPLPDPINGPVEILFGSLAAAFGQVVAYFFGSSAGSVRKDLRKDGENQKGQL